MSKDNPTFEDAVDLLAGSPTPVFIAQNAKTIYAGLIDLRDRVQNLEHNSLEATYRLSQLETAHNAMANQINAIEAERAKEVKRLDAMEKAPAANQAKLDDMEARLRTVEGAVGSKNFKDNLTPIKGKTGPQAVQDFPAPRPSDQLDRPPPEARPGQP